MSIKDIFLANILMMKKHQIELKKVTEIGFNALSHSKEEKCFKPISLFVYIVKLPIKSRKRIENEDKITFHLGRMYRPSHRAFAMEKNSSYRKPVWQVVFRFSLEIFTLSGSRYNFLRFYRFLSQNIAVKWRYLLL